nr:probable ubiquitin carboxyl-terminal hydrolase FAF-X [Lytechinus pictus]
MEIDCHCRPFGQCYQQLTADTIKSYFLPTVDSVCSHLLSCSDRQLFQQDIQVGDLQATYLVGPRAAYVIVEAVMNLLSAVKSEEAEAEVKVQYWQDTILTRYYIFFTSRWSSATWSTLFQMPLGLIPLGLT